MIGVGGAKRSLIPVRHGSDSTVSMIPNVWGEMDGTKKSGTNPRALGTNPKALGTNPRALGINPRALGTNPRARRGKF